MSEINHKTYAANLYLLPDGKYVDAQFFLRVWSRIMLRPVGDVDPDNCDDGTDDHNTTENGTFEQTLVKMKLQNITQLESVPFFSGLREPTSCIDDSPGDCHSTTNMNVSTTIPHDTKQVQKYINIIRNDCKA